MYFFKIVFVVGFVFDFDDSRGKRLVVRHLVQKAIQ